jgi:hypothetical protein
MHEYDKSSKWLIQHHGDSILRLGGVREIVSWRALQAELIQPRRLPDGLIEAQLEGQVSPDPFVVEIFTYPDARAVHQALEDALQVYLDRKVLPEVLVVFLHPKGKLKIAGTATLRSNQGFTELNASWKIVRLWKVPVDELLELGDVGLIPWVPLARFDGPAEPILQRCRARIDQGAPPKERENLLAVTQVMARLRYNDQRLFQILGGRKAMIESPILRELKEEWTREAEIKDLMTVLVARFGSRAEALQAALKAIDDEVRLKELLKHAARCRSLASFRKQLTS